MQESRTISIQVNYSFEERWGGGGLFNFNEGNSREPELTILPLEQGGRKERNMFREGGETELDIW